MEKGFKGVVPVAFDNGYDDYMRWDPKEYYQMYANGYLAIDEIIAARTERRERIVGDNHGFLIRFKTRTKVAEFVYFPIAFFDEEGADCILKAFALSGFSDETYKKLVKVSIEEE